MDVKVAEENWELSIKLWITGLLDCFSLFAVLVPEKISSTFFLNCTFIMKYKIPRKHKKSFWFEISKEPDTENGTSILVYLI